MLVDRNQENILLNNLDEIVKLSEMWDGNWLPSSANSKSPTVSAARARRWMHLIYFGLSSIAVEQSLITFS